MKRSNFLIFGIFALIVAASAVTVLAQSSGRDNPTAMTSNELSGSLNPNNLENYYSFTAGPGELTITVEVQARHEDIGVLNFELLGRNASTALLCCEFAQGDNGGTGRDVKTIKLAKRQSIILHTTTGPVGGGTFHIRFSGATAKEAGGKHGE
ncbi:MAG: hypothetical protein ABJA02_11445 [Acidobacteriota bacterium]